MIYSIYRVGDNVKKNKITKASKKRLIVFGALSLIIIGYFSFTVLFYLYKLNNLNSHKKQLNTNLTELKRQEKILTNEIEKLKDPSYIAKYARENYAYSKDGEYIIKINDKETKKEEDNKFNINIDYTYFIYGGGVLLFIILICVIKKK